MPSPLPARGLSVVTAIYLAFMVALIPYSALSSPHQAIVIGVNADPILYTPSWIVVSNSSGTWIMGPPGWGSAGYRAVDACVTGDALYIVSSRNPYILEYTSQGARAFTIPPNLPRPKHIACSGDMVAAIGGDAVRGTVLYTLGPGVLEAYPIPGAPQGLEDLGFIGGKLLAVKDSLVLELDPGAGRARLVNLTAGEWRVDLDQLGDGVLLGSLRRDPSRLALVLQYPSLGVYAIEVVGRASIAAAHSEVGGRMLTLVRPAGTWAVLVEWSPTRVYGTVSTVMSDAYTLTASGSVEGVVWQGGRLLGNMEAIILKSSSATPGLVGEGYRLVVNMDPYKQPVILHTGIWVESILAEELGLGDPVHVKGEPVPLPWGAEVGVQVYGLDRDPVSLALALAALAIPSWLLVVRLLNGG